MSLPGLPHNLDGTILVAMSDMHVGSLLGRGWFDARVAQVVDDLTAKRRSGLGGRELGVRACVSGVRERFSG